MRTAETAWVIYITCCKTKKKMKIKEHTTNKIK